MNLRNKLKGHCGPMIHYVLFSHHKLRYMYNPPQTSAYLLLLYILVNDNPGWDILQHDSVINCLFIEPHREKTGLLPMRKQRRRSASR